jgi:hypothetical protein
MQQARSLALALFAYSNDNEGAYPTGASSTEVFQKLLDGGYLSDPTILYVPYPGKVKADADQKKLKPENVSFDVTCCLDRSSSDNLPAVFLTGYKVSYVPDGTATHLPEPRSVRSWLSGWTTTEDVASDGVAVAYKSNSARFWKSQATPGGESSVPHFISADFHPDGKTYRQLTPEGPVP